MSPPFKNTLPNPTLVSHVTPSVTHLHAMAAGYPCPVCDFPKLSEPPRSEFGGGSFEICPSCGFQFGVNDDDEGISYETWRRRWEAAGMPWRSVALKHPAYWKPVAKHVAPGGAALRRPGDADFPNPAPAPVAEMTPTRGPAEATKKPGAVQKPASVSVGKKPAAKTVAATKKPHKAAPAAKAGKSAPTAKSSKPAKKSAPAKKPARR